MLLLAPKGKLIEIGSWEFSKDLLISYHFWQT